MTELHYLKNKWTFWFDNAEYQMMSGQSSKHIEEIFDFSTVEHFWGLKDEIPKAELLSRGTTMYLLKGKMSPNGDDIEKDVKLKFTVDLGNADKVFEKLVCLFSYL